MKYQWEEEKIGKAYDSELMIRLLGYLKPYLLPFSLSLLLAFLITGATLGGPFLLKLTVDWYVTPAVQETTALATENALSGIAVMAGIYLALIVGRLFFAYAHNYLLYYTGQNVMADLRRQVFGKLMRLPISFLSANPVGRLVTRATNDVEAINQMYTEVLVELVKNILLITGVLCFMFYFSWRLTLLILLLAPAAYWISIEFRNRVRTAYRTVRRKLAKLNAYVAEHLSGMRITQIFVQEENSRKEFENINDEEFEAEMEQIKIYGVFRPMVSLMSVIATALILWYGGYLVAETSFKMGSLFFFFQAVKYLFRPIRSLSQQYNILQKAMASSERIFQLLDQESEPYRSRDLPPVEKKSINGEIQFENVWFRYEPDQEWVLKDISFHIKPGERIALVGPTGSGKSTIIKLLSRLYDIQKGNILIDGENISNWDLEVLRSQISVVQQDVFLFSDDVRSNIRLKDSNLTGNQVREAAEYVGADSFISELSEGYETQIKVRGGLLSEGQRQLLAFARAIASDPPILVLDEATANIDSRTEQKILESIEKLLGEKTSIAIAHRLSTIENSDRILVLDDGRIVERGTHEELMQFDGLYNALYRLQFKETGGLNPSPSSSSESPSLVEGHGD